MSVARDPELQTASFARVAALSSFSRTGCSERTSTVTVSVEDWPAEFVAVIGMA
jgi:hypothetical protein